MLRTALQAVKRSRLLAPVRDWRRAQRRRIVCAHLDLSRPGLEIGPGHSPLLPKGEGWRVETMDWMAADDLRAKYAALGVDGSHIEPVDYIWRGEPFARVVGGKRFGWIIASHVIEHTPCLITFLRDCQSILEPDGVLSLAVPDKRYCLDVLRERSSIARVIDVFEAGVKRPTTGGAADHYLNVANQDGSTAWRRTRGRRLRHFHTAQAAAAAVAAHRGGDGYVDLHNWVFTPGMMRLLLDDLGRLGYIGMREVGFHATRGHEFFISLGPSGRGPSLDRPALARLARSEAR
jgi:hypothetical protein